MPLDPSIILQGKMPQFDSPLDTMAKVMNLKQLSQQNQIQDRSIADDQAVRDAFKNNTSVGSDGAPTLNKQAVLGDLAKSGSPQKSLDYQKLFQGQDMEKLANDAKATAELMGPVRDEPTYQAAKTQGLKMGLSNFQMLPANYDPKTVQSVVFHAMSGHEQFEQMNKEKELELKKDELGVKHQERSDARDSKNTDKIDRMTKALKDDFDADRGRAGNFGQISAKVQGADRLQTLIDSYKNGDLPKAQMEELALGMSNMLAGSSGAGRAQVEALVPHTLMGNVQDAGQWLMNEPRGAGQQKFVEQMAHTIQREKDVANDQLNSIRSARLPSHESLKRLAPDRYNALLQSYGLDPNNIKDGKYVAPSKQGASDTPPLSDIEAEIARRKLNK